MDQISWEKTKVKEHTQKKEETEAHTCVRAVWRFFVLFNLLR